MSVQVPNVQNRGWAAKFFTIWGGQALSLLGSQLVQFALIWWLTKTTGSATVLATASLVGLLPQVFLMPIAGAMVDRMNRRVVMIAADSLIALATLVLAFLFWQGLVQVWHIYTLMFVRSALGGFHWAAMQASTTLMVPKEHLARIQGFNQILNGGLSIVGAPLGALMLEWLPMQGILGIDVVTALLAVIPLLFIPIPQPQAAPAAEGATGAVLVWQDFKAGLRYTFHWPGLMMILGMATLINLILTPAFSLLPILVTKHFEGGAIHLAWLESIYGIGMIAGGVLLGVWGGFKRRVLTTMLGLVALGVGCVVVGLTPASTFPLAVGALLWLGIASPITNGPLFAAVQAVVEPEMQGRVFTLINAFASAMSPLGLLVAGPVADRFGVPIWFVIGGVVTIAMGVIGRLTPAVMNFEDGPPGRRVSPEGPVLAAPAAESAD